MMYSTKAEYGLRAIIKIAQHNKKPLSLANISKSEGISQGYLEKLISKLKKAGLVISAKGMNGGYLLGRPVDKIRMAEIILALEGSLAPFYCVENLKITKCGRKCLTKKVWETIYSDTLKSMNKMTLKKLIK